MAIDYALTYDPRYHTFVSWASLLCEQYAAQQLEVPNEGTDWQKWASGLLAIDAFTSPAAPNPYTFGNWQDWAAALVNVVNGTVE